MKIAFDFVFDRKNRATQPKQKGLIEFRAYLNRSRYYHSTKTEIYRHEWNGNRKEVNQKHPNADLLNIQLRKMITDIEALQAEHVFKKKPLTLDDVKAYFKNKKVKPGTYTDFVRAELEADRELSVKTKRQHLNTITKMLQFAEQKEIPFTAINYDFITRFINYLRSTGAAPNTVHKHHKNTKKYIDIAIKKGYIESSNPCKDIRVKSEEKKRDVLTENQRATIERLTFGSNDSKLELVRDMFLFACYTGLRISDVCGLRTEYVKQTEQGLQLDFYTKKVNKHAVLPLYTMFPEQGKQSKPEQLINKYYTQSNPFVFPKLSEQYINRHLKVIASMANIPFNLTFHIGRETFGTYMANKVHVPTLRGLMQHSDVKTTMRYVHLSEKMIEEQLTKVDW